MRYDVSISGKRIRTCGKLHFSISWEGISCQTIRDGCFHCIRYVISHDNPWHMQIVRCKSRYNIQTRFITIRLRCLALCRARNALHLGFSTSQLLRSEASEAKVGSGGYEGNDDHGQAEGQQELGEHVGSHCWGGVGVVRHVCESCLVVGFLEQYRTACDGRLT